MFVCFTPTAEDVNFTARSVILNMFLNCDLFCLKRSVGHVMIFVVVAADR